MMMADDELHESWLQLWCGFLDSLMLLHSRHSIPFILLSFFLVQNTSVQSFLCLLFIGWFHKDLRIHCCISSFLGLVLFACLLHIYPPPFPKMFIVQINHDTEEWLFCVNSFIDSLLPQLLSGHLVAASCGCHWIGMINGYKHFLINTFMLFSIIYCTYIALKACQGMAYILHIHCTESVSGDGIYTAHALH